VGYTEYYAARQLAGRLAENGFDVDLGVAGMPTAYRATFGRTAPVVALMAEMDAMPETGHSCGHNLMATASLLAALALSRLGDALPGRIMVLGSPAEEVGEGSGGKALLVSHGYLDGVTAAMQVHPAESSYLRRDVWPAWTHLELVFHVRRPRCIGWSPDDVHPYEVLIRELPRKLGAVEVAAAAPPVQDARVPAPFPGLRLRLRLGSARLGELPALEERAIRMAADYADRFDLEMNASLWTHRYADMIHNHAIGQAFLSRFRSFNDPMAERAHPGRKSLGDMGNVSQVVPSIHPFIGIGADPKLHTEEYARAAMGEGGRRALLSGARAMALTALDIMESESLRDRAWREFLLAPR